jgi:hypothetical protein
MHTTFRALLLAAAISVPSLLSASDPPRSVTVQAGDVDRQSSIVTFKLPAGNYLFPELRDAQGARLPLQVEKNGDATFTLDRLARGATRRFELVAKTAENDRAAVMVRAKKEGSQYWFSAGGQPVLYYQMEPSEVPAPEVPEHYRHGAHLMVFSPAGRLVTGDYPPDHFHHRGVFFGWTKTDFEGRAPDFWNMGKDKSGKFTGEVRFESLAGRWSGVVHGGFIGKHRWLDHTGDSARPVLDETWRVIVHDALTLPAVPSGKVHVFDFESTQTCASDAPLKLPQYYYGGLGFRGSRQWEEKGNFHVLTADGETDRKKSNQNRCRWIALSGKVDGAMCGLAILDHPANFRHPQTVRVNPNNPQTCHSVSETGDWAIVPGKPYVSRYRFVVFDGPADGALLERLWQDYANPPQVTVQ